MKTRLMIILLCLTSMVGCTSMQSVKTEPSRLAEQLEAGDRLVIYENSGRVIDMTLAMIDGDTLRGALTIAPATVVEVNIADIQKIEVEKIDGGMTALAVVGGAAAVVVIVPLLAIGALAAGMSGS